MCVPHRLPETTKQARPLDARSSQKERSVCSAVIPHRPHFCNACHAGAQKIHGIPHAMRFMGLPFTRQEPAAMASCMPHIANPAHQARCTHMLAAASLYGSTVRVHWSSLQLVSASKQENKQASEQHVQRTSKGRVATGLQGHKGMNETRKGALPELTTQQCEPSSTSSRTGMTAAVQCSAVQVCSRIGRLPRQEC